MADLPGMDITNRREIVTYSWHNVPYPTISAAGHLPSYRGRYTPLVSLRKDSEPHFEDVNAAKLPQTPWMPGIKAIRCSNPEFEFDKLDILLDGELLDALFRYSRDKKSPLKFAVQLIGNMAVCTNYPVSEEENLSHDGYRVNFAQAHFVDADDRQVRDFLAHYRIITYQLDDLHIMLRHRIDGFCAPKFDLTALKSNGKKRLNDAGEVTIHLADRPLPLDRVMKFDLCRRMHDAHGIQADTKPVTRMRNRMPEAWMSQVPLYLMVDYETPDLTEFPHAEPTDAIIRDKTGDEVRLFDISAALQPWVSSNQGAIYGFHDGLQEILAQVRERRDGGDGNIYLVESPSPDPGIHIVPDVIAKMPLVPLGMGNHGSFTVPPTS